MPSRAGHRAALAALLAPVAALLLAGCGDDGSGGTGGQRAGATGATASTAPAPATGTPSTGTPTTATPSTAAPSRTASASASADSAPADGDDVGACADGTCEVWARAGDRIRFDARGRAAVDLAEFNVVGVDRQLRYTAAGSGGGTNFSGASTAPGTIIVNGLRIKLVRIDDGRALLRMT